jgi:Holliday junction resolvasome RuvABC endonuclease subunit
MIIAGIDPGIATLGWATVDQNGRVLQLGVSILPRDKKRGAKDDLIHRCGAQSEIIQTAIADSDRVVSEAISWGMPGSSAMAMIASACAMTVAICQCMGLPLQFVTPQKWQAAVAPQRSRPATKIVDKKAKRAEEERRYREISIALTEHVVRSGASARLESIRPAHRNHALDAVGLAVFGAMHWGDACS